MTQFRDKSLLVMFIAGLFFFLMGVCVKELKLIPTSEIVFFRAFIALFLCYIQFRYLRISPWGKHKGLLIARGLFGTCALVLFFATLKYMPISTALSIQYLSPIFVAILSVFILNNKVQPIRWLFFFIAFAGTVIIKGFSPDISLWALIMGVLGALGSASAYICIAKIKDREHPIVIIFYFPLITVPVILPFAIRDWVTPNSREWILLILVGVFVQIAQYFMTLAFQRGNPSRVSIISYLGVIYALFADYLYFDSPLTGGALLGMALILAGVIGDK